jgi:hyperosmotically inducible protein
MRPTFTRAVALAALAIGVVAGSQPGWAGPPAAKAKHKAESAEHLMGNAGLTGKVKSALLADKVAPGLAINVNSNGGVVTLLGHVDTAKQKTRAAQVAQKVEGVKKVVNKLKVKTAANHK